MGFRLTLSMPTEASIAPAHVTVTHGLPDVVLLAEGLPVPDEAGVVLVEEHLTLAALETGGVPLQVGGHAQDKLVVDLAAAADTQRVLAAAAGGPVGAAAAVVAGGVVQHTNACNNRGKKTGACSNQINRTLVAPTCKSRWRGEKPT